MGRPYTAYTLLVGFNPFIGEFGPETPKESGGQHMPVSRRGLGVLPRGSGEGRLGATFRSCIFYIVKPCGKPGVRLYECISSLNETTLGFIGSGFEGRPVALKGPGLSRVKEISGGVWPPLQPAEPIESGNYLRTLASGNGLSYGRGLAVHVTYTENLTGFFIGLRESFPGLAGLAGAPLPR